MKENSYKKSMYGYRYSSFGSIHQEIEEIKALQKQAQTKTPSKKISGFLKKIHLKKKNNPTSDYTEIEFLGI